MPVESGSRLGPYEILSPIGAGGMGAVWKARDTRLDRTVAIKTIEGRFTERFEREAKTIASLNHPHICTLFDVGENYLVMEYIEGAPLKGPLPVAEVVRLGAQIAEALDAAHRKGIKHRDLKPGNVLLTKSGVKVIDFGLAKGGSPVRGEQEVTLTKPLTSEGTILGTVPYMSPEQLQGHEADARSDIFALGCVLYEMLTGRRAFEGSSQVSIMVAILEHEPAPLTEPVVPAWLDRIIRRCLRKNPEDRWQSARDIAIELQDRQESLAEPKTQYRSNRRSWWLAIAAAFASGAGLGWMGHHSKSAEPPAAVRLSLNPPPGTRFDHRSLAVSPDGRTVVFGAGPEGKSALWVRTLDGASERMLPGTDGASFPFWAPDGRSIGFFAAGKLWRASVVGAPPLALCDAPLARGGTWGEDGTILFSIFGQGLFRLAASGGTPTKITTPDQSRMETTNNWPQFVAPGRFLYLARSLNSPAQSAVYASTLAKPGERTRLLTSDSGAVYSSGHLLWLRGTTLMAQAFDTDTLQLAGEPLAAIDPVAAFTPRGQMLLTASPNGTLLFDAAASNKHEFIWLDRTGKRLGTLGESIESVSFDITPDGKRLAYSLANHAVWWMEMERGSTSPLTSGTDLRIAPVWFPDGRRIVYSADTPYNLWVDETNSSGRPYRLTESPNGQIALDWSRDGRFLLYREFDRESSHLWVLTVGPDAKAELGSKPRRLTPRDFRSLNGVFSPEPSPRWIAYDRDETGQAEVYVQSFAEPVTRVQVSKGGGRRPQWSAGGREVLYEGPNRRLTVVDLKITGNSVIPSEPRELFTLPESGGLVQSFQATADGQRILALQQKEEASRPLSVILNWPSLLERRDVR